jgi:hypothetical protein
LPCAATNILTEVLALPTTDDIQAAERHRTQVPVTVANLDGLLAALFTTPGARLVSVTDLLDKHRLSSSAITDGLAKVGAAIARWGKYAERESHLAANWLSDLVQDYDVAQPRIPSPVQSSKRDVSVLMTIDPFFGYSTRRPVSDGLITDKTNVALQGTRYAALLALIGAARFLRAQRVAGNLVNFYVPLADSTVLYPETALPLLYRMEHTPDHAIALEWLACWRIAQSSSTCWNGLAYQVIQTQGAQQSISHDRGCLDYSWLAAVERHAGGAVIGYWRSLLHSNRKEISLEVDNLVDCLTSHRVEAWLAHLRDVAIYLHSHVGLKVSPHRNAVESMADRDSSLHSHPSVQVRLYSLKEIKEVTTAMVASTPVPLSAVLGRKEGTLRFGHALRLLGRYNPAPLRELVDALDAVQTWDQLIRILARAAQECAVAGAKSEFIIVPSDEDLKYLLDDVDQYGARTIAELLIILSALRYPRRPEEESTDEAIASVQQQTVEGE